MNSLEANIRDNKTKGQLNAIRKMVMFLQLYMVEKKKIKKFLYQKNYLKH